MHVLKVDAQQSQGHVEIVEHLNLLHVPVDLFDLFCSDLSFQRMEREYGSPCVMGKPKVAFRESITSPVQ